MRNIRKEKGLEQYSACRRESAHLERIVEDCRDLMTGRAALGLSKRTRGYLIAREPLWPGAMLPSSGDVCYNRGAVVPNLTDAASWGPYDSCTERAGLEYVQTRAGYAFLLHNRKFNYVNADNCTEGPLHWNPEYSTNDNDTLSETGTVRLCSENDKAEFAKGVSGLLHHLLCDNQTVYEFPMLLYNGKESDNTSFTGKNCNDASDNFYMKTFGVKPVYSDLDLHISGGPMMESDTKKFTQRVMEAFKAVTRLFEKMKEIVLPQADITTMKGDLKEMQAYLSGSRPAETMFNMVELEPAVQNKTFKDFATVGSCPTDKPCPRPVLRAHRAIQRAITKMGEGLSYALHSAVGPTHIIQMAERRRGIGTEKRFVKDLITYCAEIPKILKNLPEWSCSSLNNLTKALRSAPKFLSPIILPQVWEKSAPTCDSLIDEALAPLNMTGRDVKVGSIDYSVCVPAANQPRAFYHLVIDYLAKKARAAVKLAKALM